MIKGASKLAHCVSLTLGPGGRTIALQSDFMLDSALQSLDYFKPLITKDGVTVAK